MKKNNDNLTNNKNNMEKDDYQKQIEEINKKAELAFHAKIKQMELDMEFNNRASNKNRARSIHVGTAFGGSTEIMMRGDGNKLLYVIMQPVEVIELIHQLSANVGCHLALKPREDFSSWRDWRVSEAEKKHLNGFAPFVNDMAPFNQLGASGFDQKQTEQILDSLAEQKEYEYINGGATLKPNKELKNADVMATKKIVNGRKSKRTSNPS